MVQSPNSDAVFATKLLGNLDEFLAQSKEYQETVLGQTVGQLPKELQGAALEILAKGIEAHIQQPANTIVRFSRTPSLEKEFAAILAQRQVTR
jgi:hypothetical protein